MSHKRRRKMRQLVSKFQKPGSTIWYLRYSKSIGLPRRSLKTSDVKLAEAIRLNEEHRFTFGRFGMQDKIVKAIRFNEFSRLFLEYKTGQGKARNTVEAYRYALNNFGHFLVRNELVQDISLELLERYAAHRRSMRRTLNGPDGPVQVPIAEKTIRNEMITLATAFKWAERQRYVRENPATQLELPKRMKYPPRYLTKHDYLKLRAVINDEEFRDVIDFYLLTGIRRSEGPALRASLHVDLEQGILKLPQPKQRDFKTMPVTDHLLPVLKRLILRASPGDQFIRFKDDVLTGRFSKYATLAGLPKGITFHALRHTFATWLASAGVRFSIIQELLGHQDPESARIYTHAYNEDVRRAYEMISLPTN